MDTAITSLVAIVLGAVTLWFGIRWVIRAFSKYRGPRIVTCPETKKPVIVRLDSLHASLTATVGLPDIRLENCSRWPNNAQCGQECLMDLEIDPEQCLVRGMLMQWYRGKSCIYCKNVFHELHWLDHRPALLSPDGELREWSAFSLDQLPNVMATHSPVCWNCYIAQQFRREHPELVVLRPSRAVLADVHRSSQQHS
jgi:hypothetical protein